MCLGHIEIILFKVLSQKQDSSQLKTLLTLRMVTVTVTKSVGATLAWLEKVNKIDAVCQRDSCNSLSLLSNNLNGSHD